MAGPGLLMWLSYRIYLKYQPAIEIQKFRCVSLNAVIETKTVHFDNSATVRLGAELYVTTPEDCARLLQVSMPER